MDIPSLHIVADSIPQAHYRATKAVFENGMKIRTQYDRKNNSGEFIDPPGCDASVLIHITNPFNQPRYPIISFCERGKYIAEIMGAKDHLVVPFERLKKELQNKLTATEWPYAYHQRLFSYPDGQSVINQMEVLLDRLAESPLSRRAVATTRLPQIDNYLKDDLPCLGEIQLRLVEATDTAEPLFYLNMDTKWRSRDLFRAWPDNVIALTFMQATLAKRLSEKMKVGIAVGGYTDYSSSLHIYGQSINENGVEKYIKMGEQVAVSRAMDSTMASDALVIPELEELLAETHWNFQKEQKDIITNLIDKLKDGDYIA